MWIIMVIGNNIPLLLSVCQALLTLYTRNLIYEVDTVISPIAMDLDIPYSCGVDSLTQ